MPYDRKHLFTSLMALVLGMAVVGGIWFVADVTGKDSEPDTLKLWLLIQEEIPAQPDTARDGDGCSFETQPWNQVVVQDRDVVVGAYQPVDGDLEHSAATDTWYCATLVSLEVPTNPRGAYLVSANRGEQIEITEDEIGMVGIPIPWSASADERPTASPQAVQTESAMGRVR